MPRAEFRQRSGLPVFDGPIKTIVDVRRRPRSRSANTCPPADARLRPAWRLVAPFPSLLGTRRRRPRTAACWRSSKPKSAAARCAVLARPSVSVCRAQPLLTRDTRSRWPGHDGRAASHQVVARVRRLIGRLQAVREPLEPQKAGARPPGQSGASAPEPDWNATSSVLLARRCSTVCTCSTTRSWLLGPTAPARRGPRPPRIRCAPAWGTRQCSGAASHVDMLPKHPLRSHQSAGPGQRVGVEHHQPGPVGLAGQPLCAHQIVERPQHGRVQSGACRAPSWLAQQKAPEVLKRGAFSLWRACVGPTLVGAATLGAHVPAPAADPRRDARHPAEREGALYLIRAARGRGPAVLVRARARPAVPAVGRRWPNVTEFRFRY